MAWVLATAAGGLARYLEHSRNVDLSTLDFRVMTPVSLRSGDEEGTLGNRVSAWLIPLPLAERDPTVRLEAIRETTQRLKDNHDPLGALALAQVTEWTGSALISLGARLMTYGTPFNYGDHPCSGPAGPALFARRAHADRSSSRAAALTARTRHRVIQLCRHPFLGFRGGLESRTRPSRTARSHAGGFRGAGGIGRGLNSTGEILLDLLAIDAALRECEIHSGQEAQARGHEKELTRDDAHVRTRDEFAKRRSGRGLTRQLQYPSE